MKTQKQNYLSPVTETLVVRFEGGIMAVSNGINYATFDGGVSGTDNYDDDDAF